MSVVADTKKLKREVAKLRRQLAERDAALAESLARQTATAEVLQVINASSGNLAPVFDVMLDRATRLCEAPRGQLAVYDGELFEFVAVHGDPAFTEEQLARGPTRPEVAITWLSLVRGERVVNIPDVKDTELYRDGHESAHRFVDFGGGRSLLTVALHKDDVLLGALTVYRQEVRPFTERQIALLENFAAQAVIAIENARLLTETREALEQQTATAEVLQVINSSPGALKPVFDAMLEKAMRLCEANFGFLSTYDGQHFDAVALHGLPDAYVREYLAGPYLPGRNTTHDRLVRGELKVHVPNLAIDAADSPRRRAVVDVLGVRSILAVPLRRDGVLLGAIHVYRQEVRPFSDKQIALLQNFAAQAVIAMENARLITETREALEQQTATAEVLQVINSSPCDLGPVFEAILEKAMTRCDAALGFMTTYDGQKFTPVALRGVPEALAAYLSRGMDQPRPGEAHWRLLMGEDLVHNLDQKDEEAYRARTPLRRAVVDLGSTRTALVIALRKDGVLRGTMTLYRREVRLFTDRQIALVKNFAAQAVIAIENARLLTETREALEQQTATAEVLQVINSSPGELRPVFEAMLEKAMRLCGAAFGGLWTFDGDRYVVAALRGVPPAYSKFLRENSQIPGPGSAPYRFLHGERSVIQNLDLAGEELYRMGDPQRRALVDLGGARSALQAPLFKDEAPLGVITIFRQEVRPFTKEQVALLENFAAQAVIAMENARLLTETREALEQQTATAEVLGVINASPGDLNPVFDAVLEKATRLCEANEGGLRTFDGTAFHLAAVRGDPGSVPRMRELGPIAGFKGGWFQRIATGERVIHVADVRESDVYRDHPEARERLDLRGIRTWLAVALHTEDKLLGVIVITRREVRPFTDKQIALLQNFADQAVIAMENARLLTETRQSRDAAERALSDLRTAQSSLIQAQKMAALGQLTAGIAHEIKNPLNFVNNFAELSTELLGELKEEVAPALAALDEDKRGEIGETIDMLAGNLDKIGEHGRRADNIVKSMLEHSRGVSGERRAVDLNALIDEALNLAYHGARAQDQGFNITLERDFASSLAPVELAPQEMMRVFLNLFGNGFYAATRRAKAGDTPGYRPTLRVATRDAGDVVEIAVRDNGTGIPPDIREKIFQPFFTTKATGEGTGLGLSISYDIVAQQHGGAMTVESEEGVYTEFTVRLPRR